MLTKSAAVTRPAPLPHAESLRIAGRKASTDRVIEVLNPYDGSIVGTVPRATPAMVREAFDIAHAYRPKLTRYERQKILLAAAEKLVKRKAEISDLITRESGLCKKDSLYEVGRAF